MITDMKYNANGDLLEGSTITYPFGDKCIVATRREDYWCAEVKGYSYWATGDSIYMAVGDLVLQNPELFSINLPKEESADSGNVDQIWECHDCVDFGRADSPLVVEIYNGQPVCPECGDGMQEKGDTPFPTKRDTP